MAQGFRLKDQLFNPQTVGRLGDHFEKAGVFTAAPFTRDVLAQMGPLELKARINLIAAVLADYLPDDFPAAAEAILAAMPPPLDPTKTDDDFGHLLSTMNRECHELYMTLAWYPTPLQSNQTW